MKTLVFKTKSLHDLNEAIRLMNNYLNLKQIKVQEIISDTTDGTVVNIEFEAYEYLIILGYTLTTILNYMETRGITEFDEILVDFDSNQYINNLPIHICL